MDVDDPGLLALIRAVSDGARIDWDAASRHASDSFRKALSHLHIVARVANLHRSLEGESVATPSRGATPAVRPPGAIGEWGHLLLLDHVASGSFGDVYRAWDSAIDRQVALKLLKASSDGIDESPGGRIDEGRLLARVHHPNVVTIHGAARVDGRAGIWMEFVDGQTLATLVRESGPLPVARVIEIGVTLCAAVDAVHRAGLLHRDVKAQNVMLARDGRIVLMDFGAGLEQVDIVHDIAGTPLYLAPEVALGLQPSVQSDVYSLGVLLTFLLTAAFERLPGDGSGPRNALEEVLRQSTAADPRQRFPRASSLGEALAVLGTPPQPGRRSVTMLVVAATLALALALVNWPLVRGFVGAPSGRGGAEDNPEGGSSGERLEKMAWTAMPTGPPSRDGRYIGAVTWDGATGAGLPTLIDLATNETSIVWRPPIEEMQLAPYGMSSSISPDNQRIAFSWFVPGLQAHSEIRICPLHCTTPRVLYSAPAADFRVVGWSAAGTEVLVSRTPERGHPDLVWIDCNSGRLRLLMPVPPFTFVSLKADAREIALDWPQPDAPGKRSLMLADARTAGAIRPLLVEPANDAMPVWLPDGDRVLFASDRGGSFGAWLLDLARPDEPVQVRGSMGYWQPLGVGARGELYYVAQTGTVDVYTASIDVESRRVGPRKAVATSFSGRNLFSDWAPDGRHLAFTSRRGAITFGPSSQFLVIRDLDSTGEHVVPTPFSSIGPIRWSPDGRRIALPATGPDGTGIYLADPGDGAVRWLSPAVEEVSHIEWLSDRDLIFAQPGTGGTSLTAVDVETGRVEQILQAPFRTFSLSRSRDRVAFLQRTRDAAIVSVAPVEALTTPVEIFRQPAHGRIQLAGWTSGDRDIVLVRPVEGDAGGIQQVLAIPLSGEAPFEIGRSALGGDARTIGLNPQGTMLAFEAGAPLLTTWLLRHPLLDRETER